jgi:transcriptional repressor NrdR
MKCNECGFEDSKVIESRDVAEGGAVRRRRVCLRCSHRFTTYERVERPQLVVIKNDGVRQLFSREKLLAGLLRATEKTSVTSLQLERLVTAIEQQLCSGGESEVPSATIGDLAMERLAAMDEVAYVRFASVYRRFTGIASFERALTDMRARKQEGISSSA